MISLRKIFSCILLISFGITWYNNILFQTTSDITRTFSGFISSRNIIHALYKKSPLNNQPKEKPVRNVVYFKTSKTGSSTLLNVILRYIDKHNLTVVSVKPHTTPYLRFSLDIVHKLVDGQSYNILARHFKYNKTALTKLMPPDTKYVTIVREPAERLRSLFWFQGWAKALQLTEMKPYPFTYFVENLDTPEMEEKFQNTGLDTMFNRFMDKLAFDNSHFNNETLLNLTIADRARDFDLIMLTEYFDESLVLVKRLLNWELKDMIYFKIHVYRKPGSDAPYSEEQKERVRKRMRPEVIAYDFFKRIFMEKLSQQDESFWEEVEQLREMTREAQENCFVQRSDKGFGIREDAKEKRLCEYFQINEMKYLAELEEKQRHVYLKNKNQYLE